MHTFYDVVAESYQIQWGRIKLEFSRFANSTFNSALLW